MVELAQREGNKMKWFLLIILTACGPRGETGKVGPTGPEGPRGEAGVDGALFETLVPCPETATAFSEVLFRINGNVYAVYDGGASLDRLVQVPDGHYTTSDNRGCQFTLYGGDLL